MKMLNFRKRMRTGMHVAFLPKGSKVNGQPHKGRAVLRPGNTVYTDPKVLGVDGLKQFDCLDELPEEKSKTDR